MLQSKYDGKFRMTDTLIITGWGYEDYACAAAVALVKFPDADVSGCSKRRLPEMLTEFARDKNLSFKRIFILGVSAAAEPVDFISACAKLASKNVKIEFISCYPLPEGIPQKLGRKISCYISEVSDDVSLTELAASYFKIDPGSSRISALVRIASLPVKRLSSAELAWRKLIAATASRYRRFQDSKAYGRVIAALAKGIAPDERLKEMAEEFSKYGRRELKGKSKAIEKLRDLSKSLGTEGHCRVLIIGETGTGKETVAYLIHGHSMRGRDNENFIAFNCADLSPQLLESRLFGHEKGAFTGADTQRRGAFELANGGTLFLDEVAELPMEAQAGLLRVLQEGRFTRLGGEKEIEVDVRIIAATNKPLPEMVAKHKFREDLFYRLNVVNVHIPPLRERLEDIEDIANSYMRARNHISLNGKQIEELKTYAWPGNVRELENILERLIVLKEADVKKLVAEHKAFIAASANSMLSSDILDDVIRAHIRKVYDKCEGNLSRTKTVLGLGSVNTIKKYLKPVY